MTPRARYPWLQDLLILGFLGLTPLLWFTPGTTVTGGDATFPIEPIQWFMGRAFVWNDVFNCGIPAAINATSLFFHGLQALLTFLGQPLFRTQQLFYVFWFEALCFSMYYFMAVIQRGSPNRAERFLAVCFYTFNPFMFNMWEATKAAELSSLVGIPIFLAWLILGIERRVPLWALGCRTILLALVVCEVGAGPPVLAAVITMPIAYAVCRIIWSIRWRAWSEAWRVVATLLVLSAFFIIASAFWVLPYGFEIYHQIISNPQGDLGAFNLSNWLKNISTHTSLLNVSRLQGFWDWYYTWNDEPYVAYAARYVQSPLLIFLSVAFPILAYSALVIRQERMVRYVAGMTVLMTILATGAHPPFGIIYLFLTEHIPLLSMFRSPFYKFGLLVIFGYAYLIAVAARGWADRLTASPWVTQLDRPGLRPFHPKYWAVILIGCNALWYSQPLVSGEIVYLHKKLSSIKLMVPPYILYAAQWLETQEPGRILSLPKDSIDIYRWGYGSIVHVFNLASRRAVLSSRDFVAGFESANKVREASYRLIYDRVTPQVGHVLGLLHCKYLLVREDSWYNFYGGADSPIFVEAALRFQNGIRLARRLAAWMFYTVEPIPPKLYAVERLTLVKGDLEKSLGALSHDESMTRPAYLFAEDVSSVSLNTLIDHDQLQELVFYESDWSELLLDLTGVWATPFPEGQRELTVDLKDEGFYEVWVRLHPSLRPEDTLDAPLVVNHSKLLWPQDAALPTARGGKMSTWYQLGKTYFSGKTQTLGLPVENRYFSHVALVPAADADLRRKQLRSVLQQPSVGVTLALSTEAMEAVIQHPAAGDPVRIRSTHHFYTSLPWWEDHQPWKWVRASWNNLIVKNHSPSPVKRNLALTVCSPGSSRWLYLIFGKNVLIENLEIPTLAPRRLVFRNLTFKPGGNRFSFYCPQGGVRTEGPGEPTGFRSYALGMQDLQVGPARFSTTLDIPRAGRYEVALYPYPASPALLKRLFSRQPAPEVTCNGIPVPLQPSTPLATGYWWFTGSIDAEAGPCRLTVNQLGEENYFVQFRNRPDETGLSQELPIEFQQLTPTKYTVRWTKPAKGFLVLLNAFHPHWMVGAHKPAKTTWGQRLDRYTARLPSWSVTQSWPLIYASAVPESQHYQVNGYANAWHIPSARSAQSLIVVYAPQGLFEIGVVITACGAALGVLGAAGWLIAYGVRRRRLP